MSLIAKLIRTDKSMSSNTCLPFLRIMMICQIRDLHGESSGFVSWLEHIIGVNVNNF